MQHAGAPYSIRHALLDVFHELRCTATTSGRPLTQSRAFHNYFVTHLPSTSLSPDQSHPLHHKLPRADSQPHQGPADRSNQLPSIARDTTVVRIPLKSAKHHFGAGVSRGSRPYNEDTYQAGTVEIPAFAQRQPMNISLGSNSSRDSVGAVQETGDPQVFYFGVFDGHGGSECSEFLRDRLHGYIEESALLFGMESSLRQKSNDAESEIIADEQDATELQRLLIAKWKETVGGYFKRFKPDFFPAVESDDGSSVSNNSLETVLTYAFLKADLDFTAAQASKHSENATDAEEQTLDKSEMDSEDNSDRPINEQDVLSHPDRPASQNLRLHPPKTRGSSPDLRAPIGGNTRFKGGSTASVALISTPTPMPFWHPASPSTLAVAHVGDTRILLCRTFDGAAVSLTANHHPSLPTEARRLRRYAASFVTDSFGEERVLGLANTRAFGDISSKRIGVSAEPQITITQIQPASYAFMVLMSDGISGHLEDQEIVDIVKDARTPEQASRDLVSFAVEVSQEADNATALVVRLGGWERRNEGGGGSFRTKEQRDFRRQEAMNPRARRQ